MSLGDIARRLLQPAGAPPARPRDRKQASDLKAFQRIYGEKDGRTVFDAAQIKAKKRGRK